MTTKSYEDLAVEHAEKADEWLNSRNASISLATRTEKAKAHAQLATAYAVLATGVPV